MHSSQQCAAPQRSPKRLSVSGTVLSLLQVGQDMVILQSGREECSYAAGTASQTGFGVVYAFRHALPYAHPAHCQSGGLGR